MALGAIILSILSIAVDSMFGVKWIEDFPWLFANKPEGARAVLSTIAGSMITVAGVTFSITIVSVMNVAGRYGPRILTNFLRDRGNQITLGVFIATFIYCLLVLRTVRSGEQISAIRQMMMSGESGTDPFVPHLSIIVGILLALASIGVLIYFIHHVSESLHISNVIARIGRDLQRQLEKLFPEEAGQERTREEGKQKEDTDVNEEDLIPLTLSRCGYVVQVNEKSMMEIATSNEYLLKIFRRSGEFVNDHSVVLGIQSSQKIPDTIFKELRECFILGEQRTPTQDVMFLVDELVEIATIALSPGINDPFTALTCLEWLAAGLSTATAIAFPDRCRYDEKGELRMIVPSVSLDDLIYHAFDQLHLPAASSPIVARRMMELYGEIGVIATTPEMHGLLREQAEELHRACNELLPTSQLRDELASCYRRVIEKL